MHTGFCTVINCMDGRVQLPVWRYLQERFGAIYVDTVTEAGPCRILARGTDRDALDSILRRARMSLEAHGSRQLAVVAHADCAEDPVDEKAQAQDLEGATCLLRQVFPDTKVVALWVELDGFIEEREGRTA